MKREEGFSVVSFVITIAIIVVIVGVIISVALKFINQYTEEDTEFNKTEIVDTLNNIVKGKYVLDNKYAQENKKNIDEIYTRRSSNAISFRK